jgi:hypothetical protein
MRSVGWQELSVVTTVLLLLIALWSLPWKGIALWKAARRDHLAWFVILFVVNTVGLLEIIYIFLVAREPDLISQPPPAERSV